MHNFILFFLISTFIGLPTVVAKQKTCLDYEVCFTPGQACEQLIITAISAAKESIYIQAYGFTSNYIAKALLQVSRNKVEVNIILDKMWLKQPNKYRAILTLYKENIPIWIDHAPSIAHNKVMIIDNKTIITGSYNFTIAAALYNAENVLIITNTDIANMYMENWKERRKVSVRLLKSVNLVDLPKF